MNARWAPNAPRSRDLTEKVKGEYDRCMQTQSDTGKSGCCKSPQHLTVTWRSLSYGFYFNELPKRSIIRDAALKNSLVHIQAFTIIVKYL